MSIRKSSVAVVKSPETEFCSWQNKTECIDCLCQSLHSLFHEYCSPPGYKQIFKHPSNLLKKKTNAKCWLKNFFFYVDKNTKHLDLILLSASEWTQVRCTWKHLSLCLFSLDNVNVNYLPCLCFLIDKMELSLIIGDLYTV